LNLGTEFIDVELHVKSLEVPNYILNLTTTGKIFKPMAKVTLMNCTQDYVGSSILRVAREISSHLPVSSHIRYVADIINKTN
jgi:hypothetical protein